MIIKLLRRFIFFKITGKLKERHMKLFCELFKIDETTKILDIGAGGGELWSVFPK